MHPNRVAAPFRSSQQQCPTAMADAGHGSIVSRMCKNFILLGATYYTSGMLSRPCASKLRLEGKLWVPSATLTKIRNGSCLEFGASPDAASWEFYQRPDKMGQWLNLRALGWHVAICLAGNLHHHQKFYACRCIDC